MCRCGPMEQLEMTESWSSVNEVAKHTEVVQDAISRWLADRDLAVQKKGGCLWRFKTFEVDACVSVCGAERGKKVSANSKPKHGGRL